MGKTVLCWVTVIDPDTGVKREQREVPVETTNPSNPHWEILTVNSNLLISLKASILCGATFTELVEEVRRMFRNAPELTYTRLCCLMQQSLDFKLEEMVLVQIALRTFLPVEELKRRLAVLEQRQADWRQGHKIFG